ncbi:cation diffusion facilitator family transporter [Gorillibacterium massiliense]|uniref:cation diffusion facilitator family transporter n=1 Tax=Gorillibacterium massiliense TaxID=1280390 RepID=UPI000694BE88|nr:cation diffusion facilitator family transporter [Gorillibacterium massiliense]
MIAAWISLISNVLLTVMKLAVGWLFGSQVLIADGVHNAGDVIASGAAVSSMQIANRPADENHPYGHGKAEVLGAAVIALILAIAAVYMGYHAVVAMIEPPGTPHILALIAAAISLIWKMWLYIYTMRVGRSINSKGLIATAQDHLADVYASLAAVIGIFLALIGKWNGIHLLTYGDPVAGLIVSILVMKLAYEMGKESLDILMDHSIKPEMLQAITELVHAAPEVRRIDKIRGREHGQYITVDLRLSVSGSLTIQEGHDIGRSIKYAIIDAFPLVDEVLVHLNPWYPEDSEAEGGSLPSSGRRKPVQPVKPTGAGKQP